MLRLTKIAVLTALALTPIGCEGGAPWDDEDPAAEPAAGPDFGPTAAYERRMVFLGPGEQLPTAAVFDFSSLSDSTGIHRGVRARVVDGNEWLRIMDAGWELEPMRQPWRLVPHGSLRLMVNEGGEVTSLEVRRDSPVVLEPGSIIAEHAPDAGTQLILRQGRLVLDDQPLSGILLDAQIARAVPPATAPAAAVGAATDSATGPTNTTGNAATGATPGAGSDTVAATLPADTAAAVTPTAKAGAEAFLLDNSGYYLVLVDAGSGSMAWIHSGGRNDVLRGARLVSMGEESAGAAARDLPVPEEWQLLTAAGDTLGELSTEAADRSALATAEATSLGYALVSGWVEEREVRREVFGLVRHVR